MKILLMGPQGSGKSTQGKQLSQFLGVPFISTGDIFREKALQDNDEGRRIKKILDDGQLVDDQTTEGLVKEKLQNPECKNGFILDGYPRTLKQAEIFSNENITFDKVISLVIPDEVVIERLTNRGRKDDTPEVIKTRLDIYKNKTELLKPYLKNLGEFIEIDGLGTIEQVQQKIRNSLS